MRSSVFAIVLFFFNYTPTTEIYTLSLHDALPIYVVHHGVSRLVSGNAVAADALRLEILCPDLHLVGCRPALLRAFLQIGEHTSELQSRLHLVCRLLLEKKKNTVYVPSSSNLFTTT